MLVLPTPSSTPAQMTRAMAAEECTYMAAMSATEPSTMGGAAAKGRRRAVADGSR